MNELKRALVRTIGSDNAAQAGYGANILTPDLCSNIQLTIPRRKSARILGTLAEQPLQGGVGGGKWQMSPRLEAFSRFL
jgi:hypothetical protein